MAASTLFIVVLFFSFRGFFLGFTGVIARLLGVVLGYLVAFSYRGPLSQFIIEQTSINASPMLLQIASSAGLFFTTLFITGVLVTGFFKLITALVPASKELLDSKSPGSRVFGAGCNGLIGASLVLIALWAYALFVSSPEQPDTLQRIANRFGDNVLAFASSLAGNDNGRATTTSNTTPGTTSFSLETIQQLIQQSTGSEVSGPDLQQLLNNDDVQQMLNDPAVKNEILKQLQNNPEQMLDALNDPALKQLLETQ